MVSLVLVPVGMAIAHRSSPLYIVLSAFFSLIATGLEGRLRSFWRALLSALTTPLGWAVIAFFTWCVISIGWSEFKEVSLRAFGEFWLPTAAAFILSLTLARRLTKRMFWGLTAMFIVSGFLILFELKTGLGLRKALGVRADAYIFNRPVLTLLMLILPLSAWFLGAVKKGWIYLSALLLFLCVVLIRSESDASVLGLAVICLAFPLAWFVPRLTIGLAAFACLVAFSVSPLVGPIASHVITPKIQKMIASGHPKERVALWNSFGSAVRKQPYLGGGFGVSPRMAQTSVAAKVPAEQLAMLNMGHPHNAALQTWVELGAVGVVLALIVIFFILSAVFRQSHLIRCASLALLAGAAPVALVGHGAWQGWWAASLGAAIIWMQAASRFQRETKP